VLEKRPLNGCIVVVSDTNISEGNAATRLRCGEVVNDGFTPYLLLSLSVKEFFKNGQQF